jgi:hypothetical protein
LSAAQASVSKLNCAGQGCDERVGCRRYEVLVPSSKELDASGKERLMYSWGSFDIERKLFRACSARAVIVRDFRDRKNHAH